LRAQRLDECLVGPHEVHVSGDRLEHDGGDVGAEARERIDDLRGVVVVEHQRLRDHLGGDSSGSGIAERKRPGSRFHEEEIAVAVITALELDDEGSAAEAARQAQRAHHRLGARAHEPHLLDRGHRPREHLRHLELDGRRGAEGKAAAGCVAHRGDDVGVAMSEDHRPPRANVVDVLAPVFVDEARAPRLAEEHRSAPDGPKGAHRGIDAAGNDALRTFKQLAAALVHRSLPGLQ
jgi:hypothetical protein